MKKIIWLIFTAFLLLSLSMAFGQTEQEAVSSNNNEETTEVSTPAQKPRKVSEIRKVTRIADFHKVQNAKSTKAVVYDEKGGVVVPDKSEGMQQTNLTPAQQNKLAQIKGEAPTSNTSNTKNAKDSGASEKAKSQNKQPEKSQKSKSD